MPNVKAETKRCSACAKRKKLDGFYAYYKRTDRTGKKIKKPKKYYRSECVTCNLKIRSQRRAAA